MDSEYIFEKLKSAGKDELFPIGIKNWFSVLVLMTEKEGAPHFVFEVRSPHIDRQPGEICFPGGAVEIGEDRMTAALRETREELGVPESAIENCTYLGTMVQYWGSAVHVFSGFVSEENFKKIKPSREEVAEVFTVPADWFSENPPDMPVLEMKPKVSKDFPYEKAGIDENYPWGRSVTAEPVWNFEGYAIWGLTGRIIVFVQEILGQ